MPSDSDNIPDMSAEPLPPVSGEKALPRWFYPPVDGWYAEDLDRLPPEAPRHIELIDGALVVMAPQTIFHVTVINSLWVSLSMQLDEGLVATREMTVRLGDRQRPEPDVLVVKEPAMADLSLTWLDPADVVLAVEVQSPDSEVRDTRRKPQLYAEAGIRHFWRVENNEDRAVLWTYNLDPANKNYMATGRYRDKMKVSEPFPIEIDVDRLHRPYKFKPS
ncbi:MAG TPA: Uma2 family endonuclease [Pseudonocardiaceae bacterium]|nr:Uma2 family endonuclease [Pseudonocardiaceae bacterium]